METRNIDIHLYQFYHNIDLIPADEQNMYNFMGIFPIVMS